MVRSIVLSLACIISVVISGCTQAQKDADIAAIKSAAIKNAPAITKQLTIVALNKAETIAPNSTQAAANAVVTMLGNDLIPYFRNQPVLAASAFSDLMSTKFKSVIPAQAAGALDFGATIASLYSTLAIPPASKLTAVEFKIIVDNLAAIQAGATQWLAALPPPPTPVVPGAVLPVQ